jgi:hypothetical protein
MPSPLEKVTLTNVTFCEELTTAAMLEPPGATASGAVNIRSSNVAPLTKLLTVRAGRDGSALRTTVGIPV